MFCRRIYVKKSKFNEGFESYPVFEGDTFGYNRADSRVWMTALGFVVDRHQSLEDPVLSTRGGRRGTEAMQRGNQLAHFHRGDNEKVSTMRWGKELYAVFKLRIGVAIAFSALAGLAVTPGPTPAPWQIVIVALAVLLSAASAGALNHYFERDLDALMARTAGRPFVTGVFRPGPLWLTVILAMLLVAVAMAGLAVTAWVALYTFLGAFVYGVVYTVWLKRRTWLNIVLARIRHEGF